MGFMKGKRIRQVIKYGWKDAGEISKYPNVKKSRISIFLDIWYCFREYYIFSNQYKANQVWTLTETERIDLANRIGIDNKKKDEWVDVYYENWKFLNKYSSFKWQQSPSLIAKRASAYKKHFGLGENLEVQYGVTLICEHFSVGKINCGKNVLLARNCDIDYTGDITIEDGVNISEGVKILTHNHELDFVQRDSLKHGLIKTPLIIRDNVGIGARALISPGATEIGRRAMIASNSSIRYCHGKSCKGCGLPLSTIYYCRV